ncbi:hypothetical protein [Methylobacterium sp. J-090]|uniref:hypothetical protein n=1 Tax=Methylobacterium sp. J-090 TaxID=2836666 RepID=UPI001FBA41DD|nr:hypothetical protein [Methylobacterium sp. J-090]MCJ2080704.1 hypothetical protein [Methylobacterium sp. J-090]
MIGFLNDDSSDVGVRHVGVILRYWAPEKPEWDNPLRGEASVSQLKWLNTSASTIDLLEFEYWSQLSLRTLFPAFLSSRPAYKIIRPSAFQEDHLLCITGSIGSGKSITTNRLCAQAGYKQVNTGRIIASILKIAPVPETGRAEFQAKALEFIRSKNGPKKLAEAISAEIAAIDTSRIIIDGIRQLETLEILKQISIRKVATIFVHTPPDIAYRLYSIREADKLNITLSEFMKIYNAPVESEVRLIIQEADAIIYNWFGLDNYEILVENLIEKLGLQL